MKRRSTGSEVKEKIQSHIWDCVDVGSDDLSRGECLEQVVTLFKKWWADNKQIKNQSEAFTHYLMCLPSELSVEFRYGEMEELLEKWLGYNDRMYSDYEIANRYYWLIYREFNALCRKHKVTFA